jgi:RNA-splicing ligase RtcB
MAESSESQSTARSKMLLIAGCVLVAVGIIGIIMYIVGMPDAVADQGTSTGVARALTAWGAALATAGGGALIACSIVMSRSRDRDERVINEVGRPKGPTTN